MIDAWKQLLDLKAGFTKKFEIRKDIVVTAIAYERGVKLTLKGSPEPSKMFPETMVWPIKAETQRNVRTMRELAQAILDACDFVDASNPEWAELIEPKNNG